VKCILCDEEITETDRLSPAQSSMWDPRLGWQLVRAHSECGLREVLGGIGHLIDHEHYCLVMHDPDAGLTYRESARLVATWVEIKGVSEIP
jgi:hypothetical protein